MGDIDLQGLLALADVPAGYNSIRIEMDIKAKNATDAELDDLIGFARLLETLEFCRRQCLPVVVATRALPLWNGLEER